MKTDKGASAIARLKNKSRGNNKTLQSYLQLFCQEEFLRRLSKSQYAENFVLKGGIFIYVLTSFEGRTTVDIDFLLRQLPNSPKEVEEIVTN